MNEDDATQEPQRTLILDQRIDVFGIHCTAGLLHVGGAYLFTVTPDDGNHKAQEEIWLPVDQMNELCGAWLAFRKEADKHE